MLGRRILRAILVVLRLFLAGPGPCLLALRSWTRWVYGDPRNLIGFRICSGKMGRVLREGGSARRIVIVLSWKMGRNVGGELLFLYLL
jgi:hypothetical protein